MITIGQTLRLERAKTGLSAVEVAQKTGLPPKQILVWERGETTPQIPSLVKLCKFYNCSITITGDTK